MYISIQLQVASTLSRSGVTRQRETLCTIRHWTVASDTVLTVLIALTALECYKFECV